MLINFLSILEGFWLPTSSQNRSKIDKKSNQKFNEFLIWFFIDFGQFWLPKPLQTIFLNFLGRPLEGVLGPLGAKMAPRPLQDGPQTPPRWPQEPILSIFVDFFIDFWLIFCLIFDWFSMDLGLIFTRNFENDPPTHQIRPGGGVGPQGNWIRRPRRGAAVMDHMQVSCQLLPILA